MCLRCLAGKRPANGGGGGGPAKASFSDFPARHVGARGGGGGRGGGHFAAAPWATGPAAGGGGGGAAGGGQAAAAPPAASSDKDKGQGELTDVEKYIGLVEEAKKTGVPEHIVSALEDELEKHKKLRNAKRPVHRQLEDAKGKVEKRKKDFEAAKVDAEAARKWVRDSEVRQAEAAAALEAAEADLGEVTRRTAADVGGEQPDRVECDPGFAGFFESHEDYGKIRKAWEDKKAAAAAAAASAAAAATAAAAAETPIPKDGDVGMPPAGPAPGDKRGREEEGQPQAVGIEAILGDLLENPDILTEAAKTGDPLKAIKEVVRQSQEKDLKRRKAAAAGSGDPPPGS